MNPLDAKSTIFPEFWWIAVPVNSIISGLPIPIKLKSRANANISIPAESITFQGLSP